jgi:hypothetical protein
MARLPVEPTPAGQVFSAQPPEIFLGEKHETLLRLGALQVDADTKVSGAHQPEKVYTIFARPVLPDHERIPPRAWARNVDRVRRQLETPASRELDPCSHHGSSPIA